LATIRKRRGDRGHPWRRCLDGRKKEEANPLIR